MAKMTYIRPYEVVDGDTHKVCFKGRDGEIYTLSASSPKGADFIGKGVLQNLFFSQLAETVPVTERTASFSPEAPFQHFTLLVKAYDEPDSDVVTSDDVRVTLQTDNDDMFAVGDTILVQGVYGYEPDGETQADQELVVLVVSNEDELVVKAINGKIIGDVEGCMPSISRGAVLIKLGKAASTIDATAVPTSLPSFPAIENYCQTFKMMLSEDSSNVCGVISEMSDLNDDENRLLKEFIYERDLSYLYGVKRKSLNADGEDVYFTGGIWSQAGKEFAYSTDDDPSSNFIVDLFREAFTGSDNIPFSNTKYLIGGSQLMGWILMCLGSALAPGAATIFKGASWIELSSPFGVMYLTCSEAFDMIGGEYNGIVVDLAFLKRYVKQPLRGDFVDFVDKDQNRVKGLVFSEESCMMITYPKSAMRILAM